MTRKSIPPQGVAWTNASPQRDWTPLFRWLLILALVSLAGAAVISCTNPVSTSLGLRCESASDCWDNLPCENQLCGGERLKPDSGDSTADKGTSATETSAGETGGGQQCKGNVDAIGQCKEDSDCCGNQKCLEVELEFGGQAQKFNVCATCKADSDCPQGTKCCSAPGGTITIGVCAALCEAP